MLASAGGSGEVTIQSLDDNDSGGGFYETRFGSSINNHIAFAPEATSSIEPRLLVCSNDNIIRVFKVAYSRLEHQTPQLYQTETLKFNTAINQGD
ncbi:hypothetical protein E3Q22_02284 [Wallemia mellicola]|uniref:Uncharacterized protein n=1 Tax=Wallemia mellicola TaxID=1708541 RepID=A0A4T0MIT3_9BASI|nr:hypothetical protein E3Q24_02795 [Wallemia mellicola]TIB76366.1 hypothetical protein E3Q23_01861 [Wallemia mellicola]TIB79780.1 hypothetical protein E3Q22_02284 [Wallemia mellicola]TIB83259.1 hypothetical protein E3Q21_02991 [Wallemia mellicola]TIB86041.1 hypothetical protein E3Q20_02982 [Wallemia mellicola]